jgi:hypothetical protein
MDSAYWLKGQESVSRRAASVTGDSFTVLPIWLALFAAIYGFAYVCWSVYGLRGLKRGTLSSCWMSIAHGTVTTLWAGHQIYNCYPFKLDAINNIQQNTVMQLSTAYMLADLVLYLLPFTPSDWLFITHHLMTAGYMLSSLYLNRGALSCLLLMLLGESTSLFQNSWYIARELRHDSKAAFRTFQWLSPVYTYIFLAVRSGLAPVLVPWVAYHLIQDGTAIPAAHRYTWAAFALLALAGSQIWSYKLVRGLRKHINTQRRSQ